MGRPAAGARSRASRPTAAAIPMENPCCSCNADTCSQVLPSMTGFLAGANMSGDLADPGGQPLTRVLPFCRTPLPL